MYRRMFCIYGRFVEGRFVEEDVLYPWTFCIYGRFVERMFCREGRYVEGRFVDGLFVEGRFVEGRVVVVPFFKSYYNDDISPFPLRSLNNRCRRTNFLRVAGGGRQLSVCNAPCLRSAF